MNEVQPAHSKIGASSMYRWSACPGSVKLSENIPSATSVYAGEGTRAHELAEKILTLSSKKVSPLLKDVPKDMIESVNVYVEYVRGLLKGHNTIFYIEHRFSLDQLHKGLFGTADFVAYRPESKLLQVVDYKHGAGIPVEVVENPQLQYYGLGALLSAVKNRPIAHVELTIVQPRCDHPDGPIRSWLMNATDLMEFAADLIDYARATEAPDAPLVSGAHCRFCPAAGICPKLKSEAQSLAKVEFSPTTSYNPDELAHALNYLPRIEAWAKSVREFAYSEAQHGRTPPGYKLVDKRAMRKWASESDAVIELKKKGLSEAEIFERKLKSPAKIDSLVDKGTKKELEKLWVKLSSGTTLVHDSDRRTAISEDPKDIFKRIEAK